MNALYRLGSRPGGGDSETGTQLTRQPEVPRQHSCLPQPVTWAHVDQVLSIRYWQAARADRSIERVARLPRVSRFVCLQRWSIAFNCVVALGRRRVSMPRTSPAQAREDLCCVARSSNSTMSHPRQCERTPVKKSRCVSL